MTENQPGDQPEVGGEYSREDEDQLQPEDTLLDRGVDDVLDEGYTTPERWSAGEGYGNTALEEETGESLEQRLTQEEPEADPYQEAAEQQEDVGGEVGGDRSGRLVAEDEGLGPDEEKDLVAEDIGIDGAGSSAEEAAVHEIDEED